MERDGERDRRGAEKGEEPLTSAEIRRVRRPGREEQPDCAGARSEVEALAGACVSGALERLTLR
jgi:hypothetical protein